VDDVCSAIDQPLLMEADEGLLHGNAEPVVHSEVLTAPVHTGPQPLHLVQDGPPIDTPPLPHSFNKRGTSKLLPIRALTCELPLDHHLRSDARVVGAWNPERYLAKHSVPARKDVH